MHKRVTVVCQSVCLYVCKRSNCSSADLCHPNVVLLESAHYLEGFCHVDFTKMALFQSYSAIYLPIDATITGMMYTAVKPYHFNLLDLLRRSCDL